MIFQDISTVPNNAKVSWHKLLIEFIRKTISDYFETSTNGVVRVEEGCSEPNITLDVKKRVMGIADNSCESFL